MQKFVVLIVFLGLLSLPLMAQKAEVFGGYQYLHTGDVTVDGVKAFDSQGFNGWDTSVTGYFHNHLGVTGDFGGAYATVNGVHTHIYTYTGGPVVSFHEGPINPFVHALFGGVHLSFSESGGGATASVSKTGFGMMFGGGVDVKASRAVAVRLIDVDWVYYHFGSIPAIDLPAFSSSNNVRITTGLVIRF